MPERDIDLFQRGPKGGLSLEDGTPMELPARHPITGRFLAFDCEVDCLEHCAGLCGVGWLGELVAPDAE
jgi:hypothetical protein